MNTPSSPTPPTLAQQVRELQSLPAKDLTLRYAALFGAPPRSTNTAWLRRQVAWKLQEQALGGLSDRGKARLAELSAQLHLPIAPAATRASRGTQAPSPAAARRPDPDTPMVGTTLVRRWHDQDLRVEVREHGFEWNGTLYSSLSAVAKAITGAAWNGRLFFGLAHRRAGA